jgi:isocitrate/isopropylmalate dehydrogenase
MQIARVAGWLLPEPTERAARRPKVVAIGGDGIGPDVVRVTVACLRAMKLPIEIVEPEYGAAAARAYGTPFPDSLREELDRSDAVLFGAIDTGAGQCREILRHLRFGLDCFANVRPAANIEGVGGSIASGSGVNLVVVRELSEGMYPAREGDLSALGSRWPELCDALGRPLPRTGTFAIQVVTERACERVARYAANLAAQRKRLGIGRGHVTIVAKDNVLRQSDGLFRSVCSRVVEAAGGLTQDHLYVDDAARRIVACPETFDVILTTNLYGDILSDIASEIMGGIAMAPSAAIGSGHAYFEPCHGSAPDLAGRDQANPTATLLSAAMLLSYLGLEADAQRLHESVFSTIRSGFRTRDLGGTATTSSFASAVSAAAGPARRHN